jgi:hypothetical protein
MPPFLGTTRMLRTTPLCTAAVLALACLSGCARWLAGTTPIEGARLPAVPIPPDSAVLEITFARLPLADEEAYREIWQHADEQYFSTDLRRRLLANGLRCGILGNQLPPRLCEVLDRNSGPAIERIEDALDAEAELTRSDRRIQCRSGRRAKVYTSKRIENMALLTQEEGPVRGWLLSDAQCLFGMKVYPQGDGRAKVELVPEVEHGQLKTQYVGREGVVMPQVARERVVLEQFGIEAVLTPGHILMISTTPEPKGVGEQFFVEQAGGLRVRALLLIRLAVTQHDDLFAPDRMPAPLATPVE